jgi:hypothetical protein
MHEGETNGELYLLFQIINRLLRLGSDCFLGNCPNVGKNGIEVSTRVHHLVIHAKFNNICCRTY